MQPGFDLRIRTMIKALSETVLPAVDSTNRAAIEQAHIVIGSLELLRQQVDYAHWFEVADARGMVALIQAINAAAALPSANAAGAAADDAVAVAARGDVRLSAVRDANRRLRDAISRLIEEAFALADDEARRRVQALVLGHGAAQIGRERAFVAATGFDVFPETMRSIEDALRPAA